MRQFYSVCVYLSARWYVVIVSCSIRCRNICFLLMTGLLWFCNILLNIPNKSNLERTNVLKAVINTDVPWTCMVCPSALKRTSCRCLVVAWTSVNCRQVRSRVYLQGELNSRLPMHLLYQVTAWSSDCSCGIHFFCQLQTSFDITFVSN